MKLVIRQFTLPIAVSTCLLGLLCRPVSADSTADLILNLRCQGGYNVQVWRNRTTKGLTYRSQSSAGNVVSTLGMTQKTEGVTVYKFRNGSYEYWVWDGTLDSSKTGTLEVYKNNRILMQRHCQKN